MISEQQIRDMEPGRELDALVAEKVMGYKIESPWAEECTIWDGREVRYFEPSTDMNAAWEVMEKTKRHRGISVYTHANGKWACEIGKSEIGDCEAASEAISKCALIAILRGGSGE